MDSSTMCTALVKISLLVLSLTWCPAGIKTAPPAALQAAGVHIHISAEAVELSIRWPRPPSSQARPRPQESPGAQP